MPSEVKPQRASSARTFIAVEFSADTRAALGGLAQRLAQATPERTVSWVKPELMHLTLKFLGDTPEAAVPKIAAALDTVANGQTAFAVQTCELGCFPNLKRPRVVWMGFDAQGVLRLGALNRAVEIAVAPLGFPTEARPFSAHLTLGRVRKEASPSQAAKVGESVRALKGMPTLTDILDSILLIKSELRPAGPVYTVLHKANLEK